MRTKLLAACCFLLSILASPAITLIINESSLTSVVKNRAITVNTRTGQPIAYGTNLFSGPQIWQPVNGMVTTNLPVPGVYSLQVDGITQTWYLVVPLSTNTYNALDLINAGLALDAPVTAFAAGTNMIITTNLVGGQAVYTFSSTGTNGASGGGVTNNQFLPGIPQATNGAFAGTFSGNIVSSQIQGGAGANLLQMLNTGNVLLEDVAGDYVAMWGGLNQLMGTGRIELDAPYTQLGGDFNLNNYSVTNGNLPTAVLTNAVGQLIVAGANITTSTNASGQITIATSGASGQNAAAVAAQISTNNVSSAVILALGYSPQTMITAATNAALTLATNWGYQIGANDTNYVNLTQTLTLTIVSNNAYWFSVNGTNFAYLIGQNDTNFVLYERGIAITQAQTVSSNFTYQIGANDTNFAYLIGLNDTNFAYFIGFNSTNWGYQIGQNVTNALIAATNNTLTLATNWGYQIGLNGTNLVTAATNAALTLATNWGYQIGLNGTNFGYLIGQNGTNALIAATNNALTLATNWGYQIGLNGTNALIAATNNTLTLATNWGYQIGLNGTNALIAATNNTLTLATNWGYQIGLNGTNALIAATNNTLTLATNWGYKIGANNTNFVYLIGGNDTNFAYLIGQNGTNALIAATNNALTLATNWGYQIGANDTNYIKSATNTLSGVAVSLATDLAQGAINTNLFLMSWLAARAQDLASPPNRYCTWYGNYNGGGAFECCSNTLWKVGNLYTNYGLDRYEPMIVQLDDGFSTNRDVNGNLLPWTNQWGAASSQANYTNTILLVKAMSPNLSVGQYRELRLAGTTSASNGATNWVGTTVPYTAQDATNDANANIEYLKLDCSDISINAQSRFQWLLEYAYRYKLAAAGLGHKATVKVDMIGNTYNNITNFDMGMLMKFVDVWGYGGDLHANYGGGFYDKTNYTWFQTNMDTGFVPMYNAVMSKGHWMNWEGLLYQHCATCGYATGTNALQAELSVDASVVMFNMERENSGPDNSDTWMLSTNALLNFAWRNFTTKAQLVYQDAMVNATNQVWKRDLGNGSYLLWFWNRQYSNTASLTLTPAQMGLPAATIYQNQDLFYNFTGLPASPRPQTYYWTNSLTVNLWPAQSHLVICTPANSSYPGGFYSGNFSGTLTGPGNTYPVTYISCVTNLCGSAVTTNTLLSVAGNGNTVLAAFTADYSGTPNLSLPGTAKYGGTAMTLLVKTNDGLGYYSQYNYELFILTNAPGTQTIQYTNNSGGTTNGYIGGLAMVFSNVASVVNITSTGTNNSTFIGFTNTIPGSFTGDLALDIVWSTYYRWTNNSGFTQITNMITGNGNFAVFSNSASGSSMKDISIYAPGQSADYGGMSSLLLRPTTIPVTFSNAPTFAAGATFSGVGTFAAGINDQGTTSSYPTNTAAIIANATAPAGGIWTIGPAQRFQFTCSVASYAAVTNYFIVISNAQGAGLKVTNPFTLGAQATNNFASGILSSNSMYIITNNGAGPTASPLGGTWQLNPL